MASPKISGKGAVEGLHSLPMSEKMTGRPAATRPAGAPAWELPRERPVGGSRRTSRGGGTREEQSYTRIPEEGAMTLGGDDK